MKRVALLSLSILILALCLLACSSEPQDVKLSVSFNGGSRYIVPSYEGFDADDYYWKYAARKLLVLGEYNGERNDLSAQTPSYDEEGAEFIHEDEPGLDGKVDGFSEGNWDFLLFAYKRSGEEGSYTYSLVYRGETKAVPLVKDEENIVTVAIGPVTDHGDGEIFVDSENITFAPKDEAVVGDLEKNIVVMRLSDGQQVQSESSVYVVEPGVYVVGVSFSLNGYIYAQGSVVVNVYSNQTVAVAGDVDELVTFVSLDTPDQTGGE